MDTVSGGRVGVLRSVLLAAVAVALLGMSLALGSIDAGALPGAAGSTDPMPPLCSHSPKMSGEVDARYGEQWVADGATVTFRATDMLIKPSTYVGSGRGEYLYYATVIDLDTSTQLWEHYNIANVGIVPGAASYDWRAPTGSNSRGIGIWTNTTGGSKRFLVKMRAVRSFAARLACPNQADSLATA